MVKPAIENFLLKIIKFLSSTFQKLQANTNEIWRFQRYLKENAKNFDSNKQ